jgi:hypothetical protein
VWDSRTQSLSKAPARAPIPRHGKETTAYPAALTDQRLVSFFRSIPFSCDLLQRRACFTSEFLLSLARLQIKSLLIGEGEKNTRFRASPFASPKTVVYYPASLAHLMYIEALSGVLDTIFILVFYLKVMFGDAARKGIPPSNMDSVRTSPKRSIRRFCRTSFGGCDSRCSYTTCLLILSLLEYRGKRIDKPVRYDYTNLFLINVRSFKYYEEFGRPYPLD